MAHTVIRLSAGYKYVDFSPYEDIQEAFNLNKGVRLASFTLAVDATVRIRMHDELYCYNSMCTLVYSAHKLVPSD